MSADRMGRIGELLEQALALPAADRSRFLDAECGADAELRSEVESLIASHEQAGSRFLNPSGPVAPSPHPLGSATVAGRRIGPYEIVERVGRGGMGDVFAAVRADGQYEQKVALKLVRAGYASAAVVERFRAERQILASLGHPNIARLLDGGTTDDGAPYLVMELVDGVQIDQYCESHELTVAQRLALFLQVCAAVQFAHQRLVIHRDIKPGNILVTATGVPKLLDFGIAKMLDAIGTSQDTMLRPFTPEYASPEQMRGEPVSTASDVYSLGVVLYRLLTGRSPYRLETGEPAELARAITTQDPERPSTAVLRRTGEASGDSEASPRLQRQLNGDLDAILLKALRKEPEKRYASAEQLADDIRRHLDGLPVGARKGTWTYLAGKFVRRHRAGAAAAALVLVTLIGGIVVTTHEARIAEANRRRADARFNDVRKLANSLVFEVHDSIAELPGATAARQLILQRALEYLDSLAKESNNEPDINRELAYAYLRIGVLQSNEFKGGQMGDIKAAALSYQKAVALREALARSNPGNRGDQVELAGAYQNYGEFEFSLGNLGRGFDDVKRGLAILDREARTAPDDQRIDLLTRSALETLGTMQAGNGLMGRVGTPEQGVADIERALRMTERDIERAPSNQQLQYERGTMELFIGQAMLMLDDRPAALSHYRRGLDVLEVGAASARKRGAAFNRAVSYGKIGDILLIDGKPADALPFYARSHELSSSLASSDPRDESLQIQDVISVLELGYVLVQLGRVDEGMGYIRKSVAKIESANTVTPHRRSVEAFVRGWYGEVLEGRGQVRDALQQYTMSKERLRAVRVNNSPNTRVDGYLAAITARRAAALAKLGETDKAVAEYEEVRAFLEPMVTADPKDYELIYVLGETYTSEGRIAAARARATASRAEKLAQWEGARQWFHKSLEVWRKVPHPARFSTSGFAVTVPPKVAEQLAECDRAIASLGSASHE
jgi:non-specific serine/threonine protein kinase/serine/threonine-protein kinase